MPTDDTTLAGLMGQRPPAPVQDWYRITNEAAEGGPSRAKINIYDAIGGWWGTNAAEFVAELDALDVDELELHINSPGGSVWDGLAIMNSLKAHRARVTAIVDGLAASAASIVAMGADVVVMAEGSQMMIHRASGGAWGNGEFLRQTALILDKIDQNMAGIYARKAGGAAAAWLELMDAETWYDAAEAVAAGLADRTETAEEAVDAEAAFDLSIFTYAGRSHAPAPRPPAVAVFRAVAMAAGAPKTPASNSEPGQPNQKEDAMAFESLMAGLRERLGATDAADEATILAAVDEALAERAETTPAALPEGVVAVDQATWDQMRADAAEGRIARQEQIAARRAQLVDAAVADGRIPPARRDHWLANLNADEEGFAPVLAGLAPNTIPLEPAGYTGADTASEDALYNRAWGSGQKEA